MIKYLRIINYLDMRNKLFFQTTLLVAASFTSFFAASGNSAAQDGKPNILFIAVDDMNDWVGPLGGLSIAKTPNLDKLAAQGVTFTNAHIACPACAPSRVAIMTEIGRAHV